MMYEAPTRQRPHSASAQPTQYVSPVESVLSSYSFPPPPRTAEGVKSFSTSTSAPPELPEQFIPLIEEKSPEPQFSFQPPLLSHFLPPEETRPYSEPRGSYKDDISAAFSHREPEPIRFSTLGQAIYDGQDARQVLSSFSFSKLLTPYLPHEDQLPSPPPIRSRRPEYIPHPPQNPHLQFPLPRPPHLSHHSSTSSRGLAPAIQLRPSTPRLPSMPTRRDRPDKARLPPRQDSTSYSFPPPAPLPPPIQSRRYLEPISTIPHKHLLPPPTRRNPQPKQKQKKRVRQIHEDDDDDDDVSHNPASPVIRTELSPLLTTTCDTPSASASERSTSTSLSPQQSKQLSTISPSTSSSTTSPRDPSSTSSNPAHLPGIHVYTRSTIGIYRPSPQSMLAPEAVREVTISQHNLAHLNNSRSGGGKKGGGVKGLRGGRAWNAPLIPSGIDFDLLPTKASRGRKVPSLGSSPVAGAGVKRNLEGAEKEVETVGEEGGEKETGARTGEGGEEGDEQATRGGEGNGKQQQKREKKVWVCKVKDCGKFFKRGEHLQRHVRSIHTGEKPFQCQWPGCGKYFSRHDNLNQHLRVHRAPLQSIEEFSAQVEACFNRRLQEVERESREIARQVELKQAEENRKRLEGLQGQEESIYVPPVASPTILLPAPPKKPAPSVPFKNGVRTIPFPKPKSSVESEQMKEESKTKNSEPRRKKRRIESTVTRDYTSSASENEEKGEKEGGRSERIGFVPPRPRASST